MTNINEQTLIKKQLYFLNLEHKTEKIGEAFIDDFKWLAEKYVEEKFQSKLNFSTRSKLDVQEDLNNPNEYYLFDNNSLYKKESVQFKGYLWNSSSNIMKKIGKFIIIETPLIETPFIEVNNIDNKDKVQEINKLDSKPSDIKDKKDFVNWQHKMIQRHIVARQKRSDLKRIHKKR